jgi:hypothetical protein
MLISECSKKSAPSISGGGHKGGWRMGQKRKLHNQVVLLAIAPPIFNNATSICFRAEASRASDLREETGPCDGFCSHL